MTENFDLEDFLPYRLNQAAEVCSLNFAKIYRQRYGLQRTEWRVLFHLGRYGKMSAHEIAERAMIDKTKISRAVRKLETKCYLSRSTDPKDRRREHLNLTKIGNQAFKDLAQEAKTYNQKLAEILGKNHHQALTEALSQLSKYNYSPRL